MPQIETVTATQSYRTRCEDRVAVFTAEDRTVIVVADGAGGMGAGDLAAETVLREIRSEYRRVQSAEEWQGLLAQIDCRIGEGESTAVVVDIGSHGIIGASVGDSQAWMIAEGAITELTRQQNRKPLLGSGCAAPVSFKFSALAGVLLVATDGFYSYAKRDAVVRLIAQADF